MAIEAAEREAKEKEAEVSRVEEEHQYNETLQQMQSTRAE